MTCFLECVCNPTIYRIADIIMWALATCALVGLVLVAPPTAPAPLPVVEMRATSDVLPISTMPSPLFPPTTITLATFRQPSGEIDLSEFLDTVEDTRQNDATRKAAALRAQNEKEEAVKAERARVAIERMDETEKAKERDIERRLASGVPLCKESVWGSGQSGRACPPLLCRPPCSPTPMRTLRLTPRSSRPQCSRRMRACGRVTAVSIRRHAPAPSSSSESCASKRGATCTLRWAVALGQTCSAQITTCVVA